MNIKNFIISVLILIIICLVLTKDLQGQGMDINVIIVEASDVRTSDVGVPSLSVNFPVAVRGNSYVTDMESTDVASPYPFVIRNIGNNPVNVTLVSVTGDMTINCIKGSGNPFCSSDSKTYFWVEQAYAGNVAPWSSLDPCGITSDDDCYNYSLTASLMVSKRYTGGATCKSANAGALNDPTACCAAGALCLNILDAINPTPEPQIITGLRSIDGTGGNTRNEALLHVKITIGGAGSETPETSGAKSAKIRITGSLAYA